MTSPGLAAVESLRARLWDAGFRPLAVYNWDGGGNSPGKVPKGREWQDRARRNPPEAAERHAEADAVNTGVLCDGLRAIDIDLEDTDLANTIKHAVLAKFGEAPIRYRRNTGRCLLVYRAAAGTPEKREVKSDKGKVEVLGRGQQFVAFGRHHTGADLEWMPEPLHDIAIDQVPALTEDQVTEILIFAARTIGASPPGKHVNGTGAVSVRGLLAADQLQVIAAISAIPNDYDSFDGWNRIGMALFAATGGAEAGRAIWHAWSQQHPSYDQANTESRWQGYFTSPPDRIGAGTLFHIARERRPPPPEEEQAPAWLDDAPLPEDHESPPEDAEPAPEMPPVKPKALHRITAAWDESLLPPRPWVAPGFLLRNSVTVMAGPGSAGKSSLVCAWTAAHAMGVEFGRFRSHTGGPLKTLFYNVEDDADEQMRRYSAMGRQFGCLPADLLKNLTLVGPTSIGTLLSTARDGSLLVNTEAMNELECLIDEVRPESVWLDPFVELHGAEENDNTAIRAVMARFRQMARTYETAVGILFHTRKGPATPGDPDQIRGASSIVGAGRIALTVAVMAPEEAEKLGVPEANRRDYFRVDDAKKNYSRLQEAEWFERTEYLLENGDRVAVPTPWFPPSMAIDQAVMLQIEAIIARGSPVGPWSPRMSADARSIALPMAKIGIESRAAQTQALQQMKASGTVQIAPFRRRGKSRDDAAQGLRTSAGEPSTVEWID